MGEVRPAHGRRRFAYGAGWRQARGAWMGLLLQTGSNISEVTVQQDWEALLAVADATAATEMVVQDESSALLIERLAQGRYWSDTQAHLLAQHIIWSRLDFLKGRRRG